ncbi:hypothetical protein [Ciceribacter sp. L1K23]|uniref:hypothetical protein n=1 Tax=Ciceribacter sp. L1K23 TaxID=2820276 RepID=UPI0020118ABC|nr:hypothetical protein [Ciceribacter sp. L1K23]
MTANATGGSEAIVNQTTDNRQSISKITTLADGGWLVTWMSENDVASDIYMQRFGADGAAIGGEVQVTSSPTVYEEDPDVTALSDGGWVVAWKQYADQTSPPNAYQQRFDADGVAVGGAVRTGTSTGASELSVSLAALSDGGWVATWFGYDGNDEFICQQRFAADGSASGAETRLGVTASSEVSFPRVAALSDGGWVVAWTFENEDTGHYDICQLRFAADGTVVGQIQRVNTSSTDVQSQSFVTGLSDGGWVVTWRSDDGDGDNIYQQRFQADGSAAGGEQQVATTTADQDIWPAVAALADGGWVTVWISERGGEYDIYQQRYDASGNAVGTETLVNAVTGGAQYYPSVTALPGGGWVVIWATPDGSDSGIAQRVFAADIEGTALAETLEGTAFDETIRGYGGNDTLDGPAATTSCSAASATIPTSSTRPATRSRKWPPRAPTPSAPRSPTPSAARWKTSC